MTIPSIVSQQIIAYCGKKTYELAGEYSKINALYVRYQDLMTIRALCEDTTSPCYFAKVSFDSKSIVDSGCTCKNTDNGPCQHIAALLIAWHNEPETFLDRTQLGQHLNKSLKKDLVALIEKIADLYPTVEQKDFLAVAFC